MNLETSDYVYFHKELFSDFMKRNPEIPLCQRSHIDERVEHFYEKINISPDKNFNKIPFIGILSCSILNEGNNTKFYILDGQHRYNAYKKLYALKDFYISFTIKICNSKEQFVEYFKNLNDNFLFGNIILDNNDKAESLKKYIIDKYSEHLSNSLNPRYPNINLDQTVKYLIDTFKDSKDIITSFESLNENLKKELSGNDTYKNLKKGLMIAYIFSKTESDKKRKNIPLAVRNRLWNNEFGEEFHGLCYCCSGKVSIKEFHAGHIISVKNGGSDNISNLKVLCSSCNLSMSFMNINEFKSKYFD